MIREENELELIAAPQLSILCFRYVGKKMDVDKIDQLNSAIRDQIHLDGDYLMSPTQVRGRPVLRVCIINHATRVEHIEGLFASILRIGRSLA